MPMLSIFGPAVAIVWTGAWIVAAAGIPPNQQGVSNGLASTTLDTGKRIPPGVEFGPGCHIRRTHYPPCGGAGPVTALLTRDATSSPLLIYRAGHWTSSPCVVGALTATVGGPAL
ncbi:hypothetical protein [Rhodococcus sp. H29-C3]|uniref:hypothetical protein n=1 Tax=Rhodococcus sp. H29-C3 TaxID=3046307 RepID=UPI0024BA3D70|nr:hypothetical protein [Rhodococcus sp. H29-C3]MDJ0363472.1 hypothetical protein [Rhodococcus sp. H29-C3]